MIPPAADPNWFYSTLAQATAALVGLAGAFLLQRLISQREEVGITRRDIREECLRLRRDLQREAETARGPLDGLKTAIHEATRQPRDDGVISVPTLNIMVLGPDGSVTGQVGLPEFGRDDGLAILEGAVEALTAYSAALEATTFQRLVEDLRLGGRLRQPDPSWLEEGKKEPLFRSPTRGRRSGRGSKPKIGTSPSAGICSVGDRRKSVSGLACCGQDSSPSPSTFSSPSCS